MARSYPYPLNSGKVSWVSTAWLEDHLDDRNLQILDIQPNVHDYIQAHIPEAVYVNENLFRIHQKIPNFWMPPETIQHILRGMGIHNDVPTVIYTSYGPLSVCTKYIGDGLEQTMVAYSLARYGHNRVYVLDGGLIKWQEENRVVNQKFPIVQESDFTVNLQKDLFIPYEEFRSIKDRGDVLVIDARPSAVYEGKGPWPKAGHIPGAISIPWPSLMDDKNKTLLKPEEQIRKMITEKGVTRDKHILLYCGTGREATNEFILLKWFLGLPSVRLFEGSFTEWSAHPENPTVTGKNPR
ncbi:MAG: sulfurtransferase [Methanomicrobiales archaeon]|nr:sulfurtransferase [Methanomicrobiales archaeon]